MIVSLIVKCSDDTNSSMISHGLQTLKYLHVLNYQVYNKIVDEIEIGELGFTMFNDEQCEMNIPYETSTDWCTLETTYLAKC